MIRRPPRFTRTYTPFPDTPLFRSGSALLLPPPDPAFPPQGLGAVGDVHMPLPELVGPEHGGGDEQRQHEIDRAIGDDGGDDPLGRDVFGRRRSGTASKQPSPPGTFTTITARRAVPRRREQRTKHQK